MQAYSPASLSESPTAESTDEIKGPPSTFVNLTVKRGAKTLHFHVQRAKIPGLELDPSQISFFVGRANVQPSPQPGMAPWRERLYSGLARVATRSPDFFRIPPDRVIELGTEVEI